MTRQNPEHPVIGYIRGALFHIGLLFSALMYMFILFFLGLPLLLLELIVLGRGERAKATTRPLFHKIGTIVFANWSAAVGRLLIWIYGMKYYATSILNNNKNNNHRISVKTLEEQQQMIAKAFSAPPAGKVNIIVMNHRTVLDWLFFWGALAQCELGTANKSLKIVPKETLARIPIFGWAMQCFRFLFLSRKSTADDLATLAAAAESYCKEPSTDLYGPTILIFAEGTDLSAVHIQKSQEFAKKNDLPIWNKVLAPRALGLGHFLDSIGKNRLHQLLDLTISYEDYVLGERPTESSLIKGRAPIAQHVAIRRFSADARLLESDPTIFPLPDFCFHSVEKTTIDTNTSSTSNSKSSNGVSFNVNPKFEKFVQGLFALKEEVLTNFYHEREEEKILSASLESPCGGGGGGGGGGTNDDEKQKQKLNAGKYSQVFTDYPELGIRSEKDELWLKTSELRVRTTAGFLDRILVPFGLAIAVFLLNYYYLGLKFFLGSTFFLFAVIRFVILKKPFHKYFFEEYYVAPTE